MDEKTNAQLDIKPKLIKVKKPRKTTPLEIRKKLIECHDRGEDFIDFGEKLGLNHCTVRNIIYKWRKYERVASKVGGHRKAIIDDEIGADLINFAEANHEATLETMQKYLSDFHGINPSVTTISKYLNARLLGLNLVCIGENLLVGNAMNVSIDEVKMKRYHYVKQILEGGIRQKELVFIDECCLQLLNKKEYEVIKNGGKRKRKNYNKRPPGSVPRLQINLGLIIAITKSGVIHYKLHELNQCSTATNSAQQIPFETYQSFIREVSLKLGPQKYFLVQTPARTQANSGRHILIETAHPLYHQFLYLPPSSPFLNPLLELLQNDLRQLLRHQINIQISRTRSNEKMNFIRSSLSQIMQGGGIPESHINQAYFNVKKYYVKCLEMADIYMEMIPGQPRNHSNHIQMQSTPNTNTPPTQTQPPNQPPTNVLPIHIHPSLQVTSNANVTIIHNSVQSLANHHHTASSTLTLLHQ